MRAQVIVLVALLAAGHADATPGDDLALARKAFRSGQFQIALEKYNALLYPKEQLADNNDLAEAYVNLGVCRVETGDEDNAILEFEKALNFDPNRQLDPLVITNKRAIVLFDDTKVKIRTRAERAAAAQREADEKERIRKFRASLIGVRDNPRYLTFIPGVGQIQNGEIPKGIFFVGSQVLTLGTSIGIWAYLVREYGTRSDQVPLEDGPRVRRLQQIEIATGFVFFGLYVWGVIDANVYYKPQVRTKIDESLLPPDLQDPAAKPKPKTKPKKSSMRIVPMLTPDGAGIGIGWEN